MLYKNTIVRKFITSSIKEDVIPFMDAFLINHSLNVENSKRVIDCILHDEEAINDIDCIVIRGVFRRLIKITSHIGMQHFSSKDLENYASFNNIEFDLVKHIQKILLAELNGEITDCDLREDANYVIFETGEIDESLPTNEIERKQYNVEFSKLIDYEVLADKVMLDLEHYLMDQNYACQANHGMTSIFSNDKYTKKIVKKLFKIITKQHRDFFAEKGWAYLTDTRIKKALEKTDYNPTQIRVNYLIANV